MKTIPIEKFGKDHWSCFGYIETLCVDNNGVPDRDRMRTNQRRHPGLVGPRVGMGQLGGWKSENGSRLAGFFEPKDNAALRVAQHDDWDCADDQKFAGLIEIHGTGIHPFYKMTPLGTKVASLLRAHKTNGGYFAGFRYPIRQDSPIAA